MSAIDIIKKAQSQGTTRISYEMLPPLKGAGLAPALEAVENLMPYDPAFISITCHRYVTKATTNASGETEYHSLRTRPATIGLASALRQRFGVEVIPHLICSGMSKYDIEDSLIDMDFLGLENVLALRGDKEKEANSYIAHPQGHEHAIDLVKQIREMNQGHFVDAQVNDCHHSRFTVGVAGYPEKHADAESMEADIKALKAKVDAGADFVITQLFFDNQVFFNYLNQCREAGINVPIIPGVKPLSTIKHLSLLPQTFGTFIPETLSNEVKRHADNPAAIQQIGAEWCISQIKELKKAGLPIVHIYTMGRTESIAKIVSQI